MRVLLSSSRATGAERRKRGDLLCPARPRDSTPPKVSCAWFLCAVFGSGDKGRRMYLGVRALFISVQPTRALSAASDVRRRCEESAHRSAHDVTWYEQYWPLLGYRIARFRLPLHALIQFPMTTQTELSDKSRSLAMTMLRGCFLTRFLSAPYRARNAS